MSFAVSGTRVERGRLRFEVTFTSQDPEPVAIYVDSVLAFSGNEFVHPFDLSKRAQSSAGVYQYALRSRSAAFTGSETVTAEAVGTTDVFRTESGHVDIPLHSFRECDANGDVSNIAGNGGLLASDTTPTMTGDANKAQCITWAAGNVDPIVAQVGLPLDFNGKEDVTFEAFLKSGATNAADLGLATGWDGAAEVADAVDDSATKSATIHRVTATIAKADVPDGARFMTIRITPPAHAADAISLYKAGLLFTH